VNDKYRDYLKSHHWKKKQIAFYKSTILKVCAGCGRKDKLRLHHKNYKNLGNERFGNDIVVVCRGCHDKIHDYINDNEGIGLKEATEIVLAMEASKARRKWLKK
jgi:5-methylcytosine-specific restriction endonuclease McrA